MLSQFNAEEIEQQQQKMDHLRNTSIKSAQNMLNLLQRMPSNSSFARKNPHDNNNRVGKQVNPPSSNRNASSTSRNTKQRANRQRDLVSFGQ